MLPVVADPAAAGRQLAQGVSDHHTVQALVTQSALHGRASLVRSVYQQLFAYTGTLDHGGQGDRNLVF